MKKFIAFLLLLWPGVVSAQGYPVFNQNSFFNCVPSIKPGVLTQSLGFLWMNIGGFQFDYKNNVFGGNNGNSGNVTTGYLGAQSNTGSGGIAFPTETLRPLTDNGSGTGGLTLLALAYEPPDAANHGVIIAFGTYGPSPEVWLSANETSTAHAQGNGQIGIQWYDGSSAVGYYTAPSTLDFNNHVIIGTLQGASAAIYVDGVSKNVSQSIDFGNANYGSLSSTVAGVGDFGASAGGSHFMAGSVISLAAEFERVLTLAEIETLSNDPARSLVYCRR